MDRCLGIWFKNLQATVPPARQPLLYLTATFHIYT